MAPPVRISADLSKFNLPDAATVNRAQDRPLKGDLVIKGLSAEQVGNSTETAGFDVSINLPGRTDPVYVSPHTARFLTEEAKSHTLTVTTQPTFLQSVKQFLDGANPVNAARNLR